MATTEPKLSRAQNATSDPPDNDYPKTGHDAVGRGILFQTKMVDPWGGTLSISLSVDPLQKVEGAEDADEVTSEEDEDPDEVTDRNDRLASRSAPSGTRRETVRSAA